MPALDDLREQALSAARWPAETRLPDEDQAVQEFRSAANARMFQLVEFAERFDRDLNAEERDEYDGLQKDLDVLAMPVSQIPETGVTP